MQKHYYALTDEMPDADGELILIVTPKDYFDTNKHISDLPMDSNVLAELNSCGVVGEEMMDSMLELYSVSGHRLYKQDVALSLKNHPDFIENEEFVAFAID